jgi:hypothetical protein
MPVIIFSNIISIREIKGNSLISPSMRPHIGERRLPVFYIYKMINLHFSKNVIEKTSSSMLAGIDTDLIMFLVNETSLFLLETFSSRLI